MKAQCCESPVLGAPPRLITMLNKVTAGRRAVPGPKQNVYSGTRERSKAGDNQGG